ncbi:MAG TPA: sulfatase [Thermoanaerobaculia bacterium]|nr:sulfatase [Thermoanaerobaculia bacterium]
MPWSRTNFSPTWRIDPRAAAILLRIGLGLGLAIGLAACTRRPPPPKNVVFILVDTLRANHLGMYGYARPTSPGLDAFARSASFFANARSQASCTFPSVNSILTSRAPIAFLGQPNEAMGIPAQIPSLAEILQARGFRTAAVSASPVVRKSPSRFNPHGGYERGFESFQEDCVWQPAECVNREARELLSQTKDQRPFFLYLHYIDPHGPYAPPPDYHRRFATGHPDKDFIRNGDPNPIANFLYKGAPDPGVTPADIQFLIDLYDDEIGHLDGQITALLADLRAAGRLDDTIVVFAADHGEEFLEHHNIKHCRTVFDTEIKVPLVFQIPGVAARRIERPVQNLDIVPTLLDYLEIPTKGRAFDGRSLRALLEGTADKNAAEDVQFSLMGTFRSVSDGHYKLIHDLATGSFVLYDLASDPGETRDVLPRERRAFHRLHPLLTAWLARTEGQGAADESVRKGREEIQKLRSLGYLE